MESSICAFCTISDSLWSVNCTNLVCKLCITFWKCQDTQTLFILRHWSVFSTDINRKKDYVQLFATF